MVSTGYDLAAADPHYLDSAGKHWGISALLKINIVTCSLSFVGSLVMIIPFILFKQLRKIRHRLILGMAVNDLLQAASVLVPSAWSTYRGSIPTNSPGCNADSFFYLTFVVAGCFWTLTIAITTYVTLVQPMSKIANYMHQSRSIYFIWIAIWAICIINAGIGTALNLSVDGGGFCFFPSVAPYLYGNLVLFVPRAGTFAIIILIYVRLYIFFRQQASYHHKQESAVHEASFHVPLPTPASESQLQIPNGPLDPTLLNRRLSESSSRLHRLSALTKTTPKQIEDDSAAVLKSKLAQYQFVRVISRKDSDETIVNLGIRRKPEQRRESRNLRSYSSERVHLSEPGSLKEDEEEEHSSAASGEAKRESAILRDSAAILASPRGFEQQLVLISQAAAVQQPSDGVTPLQSPPDERSSLLSGSISVTPITEKDEAASVVTSSVPHASPLRGIVAMTDGLSPGADSLQTLSGSDNALPGFPGLVPEKAEATSKDGNHIMGLWEALASVDPVDSDDAGLAEACAEKGRRLSASEENRRVSYLMLLYPLAYGVILAVSIARLAVTLATKASPSPWLQILNRICVLGTGVVDAVIYTVIEWRFRASSRAAARSQDRTESLQLRQA